MIDKLFRQFEAFETTTMTCSRCEEQARLSVLWPTARGFICRRCLVEMSGWEFRDLRALAQEWSR